MNSDDDLIVSASRNGHGSLDDSMDSDDDGALETNELQIQVKVSPPVQRHLYQSIPEEFIIGDVLEELPNRAGGTRYRVAFMDGHEEELSSTALLGYKNGQNALHLFQSADNDDSSSSASSIRDMPIPNERKRSRQQSRARGSSVSRLDNGRTLRPSKKLRSSNRATSHQAISVSSQSSEEDSDEDTGGVRATRVLRSKMTKAPQIDITHLDELDELAQEVDDDSDIIYEQPKKSKASRAKVMKTRSSRVRDSRTESRSGSHRVETDSDRAVGRRSGRSTKKVNMRERLEDEEQFADEEVIQKGPASVGVREVFKELPPSSSFRTVHNQDCDVCGGTGNQSNKGNSPLICCQGCTTSIHKVCLGQRNGRDHIVTKIGDGDFVLQCRRCIGSARRKDELAPDLGKCAGCKAPSAGIVPFSTKMTTKQEEKLRAENDGMDPVNEVDPQLINNPDILLFRCTACSRGFHFNHLPDDKDIVDDNEEGAKRLFKKYSSNFQCLDCRNAPAKVQTLVAWRPSNLNSYNPSLDSFYTMSEDEKEYLVKWQAKSYFRCLWMPGAWVWGSTQTATRKAFVRRDENLLPITTTEQAIPEEFLRIEIVLDVAYNSGEIKVHTEAVDRARIAEIDQVYVKFEGLGYEEAVWEEPPAPDQRERWNAFVLAYNEYVTGKYFKQALRMPEKIKAYRSQSFERNHLMQAQPVSMTGGLMKEYQLEGLNYILYKFHQEKNCILADEMGLGKTIQIIATIAALIEKPKVWPFLVVVPNSTCPNWRREIKKWAPSLRVVAYYGMREARDLAMKYELFPGGCQDMRAHIVVTSFDAPTDEHSRNFFKRIKWAGLFVDEGQRLKNEKNQLYVALTNLNVSFRVLLTGTPLQNNKRELFNLLHFIDNSIDVEYLDQKYQELTAENLVELHDLIRPVFLRRTKLQVLKELPAMAQIIIPISMSTLQKQLYRTILEKSPDLIKTLFSKDASKLKVTERGSLNNILMQLRKVLCHPYLYSRAVEDNHGHGINTKSHMVMVEASAKLRLLDLMLPKLRERGHRVLIFSQFLGMLDIVEDFLMGLGMEYRRLDGTIGTIEKQKRIDEFNAPGSDLFAFLLSTRAGGVGINLATADTVIIMDPDFNPHQDMQALSRAHRIGQKNKVLVFQLMTKQSAEEKIVQIGRKKMALDHVLIEALDDEDEVGNDLTSVLAHGAQALFDKDDSQDIHYDSAAIDELLDRSQVEATKYDESKSGESQFSYARVWTNDRSGFVDEIEIEDEQLPDVGIWDKILKEREAAAAIEAAKQQTTFGRGKRQRGTVDYKNNRNGVFDDDPITNLPGFEKVNGGSDTDFGPVESDGDNDSDDRSSRLGVNGPEDSNIRQGMKIRPILKPVPAKVSALRNTNKKPRAKPDRRITSRAKGPTAALVIDKAVLPVIPHIKDSYKTASVSKVLDHRSTSKYSPLDFPMVQCYPGPYSLWFMFAEWYLDNFPFKKWGVMSQLYLSDFPMPDFRGPYSFHHLYAQWLHHGRHLPPGSRCLKFQAKSRFSCNINVKQLFTAAKDLIVDEFHRAIVPQVPPTSQSRLSDTNNVDQTKDSLPAPRTCLACNAKHPSGYCPLKLAGVEHCGLCGLAHYGAPAICPHLESETQVRLMLDALRMSTEPRELVETARSYLKGIISDIVRRKKAAVQKVELRVDVSGKMGREENPRSLARPSESLPNGYTTQLVADRVTRQA